MAVADLSGAMENQTMTSLASHIVTGYNFYNWLYAHELAHQWWGDLVYSHRLEGDMAQRRFCNIL